MSPETEPALRYRSVPLAGWGNHPVERCDVYRPERLAELARVVARAPQRSLIARGLGRAYGDASLNGRGAVVSGERLDRMLAFDPETGVLHCEAAVSLAEILEVFVPRGFFFPVTPGTKHITVGGAIAADVHGKNHHRDGSISAFLEDFRLMLASGEILDCSRDRNADAFWATVGGMGLTGIVVDARLRLRAIESAWVSVEYQKARDLDAVLESFLEHDRAYGYSVAWIDALARGRSLGRAVVMRANHAAREDLPRGRREAPLALPPHLRLNVPVRLPSGTLNPLTMRIFDAAYYHGHRNGRVVTDCDRFFYPLDSVANWNRCYGRRGVVQYQLLIPTASGRAGLIEVLEELSAANQASFLSVLKTLGAGSQGVLSFPRPGLTLSLDLPNTGPRLLEVIRRCDAIVAKHGGRVYLAKDSCLAPESLAAMYPELARFRAIKARLDPEQRFASSLARRLRIVDAE